MWQPEIKTVFVNGRRRYEASIVNESGKRLYCTTFSDRTWEYPVDHRIFRFRWTAKDAARAAARHKNTEIISGEWTRI